MPACNPNRVNTSVKICAVCVHVMFRRIAIGQPNARVISRFTDTNDLKFIARIFDVLISSNMYIVMRLVVSQTTCLNCLGWFAF